MTKNKERKTKMLDDERGMIALEATWGIEALLILAIKALEDDEDVTMVWATKEVLSRIKQLNSVVMSAIGDNLENEELRKIV
jgi:hypothetical protein